MMEQYLFMACVFGIVAMLAWWVGSMAIDKSEDRLRDRLRGNFDPHAKGPSTMLGGVGEMLQQIGQAAANPFMPKSREKQSALRRQLGYAGIYTPSAIRLVIGCKVLFLAAGLVGGYVGGMLAGNIGLGLSFGGLLGYMLPGLWLRLQISKQQKSLQMGLPDSLDLLVVCVEAGLTVDAAMQRVGMELALAHPRLARELEVTHMETRVGLPRADALKNLGVRTGNNALRTLATMLIQAERFGTSIAAALRIHAESMRAQRQHSAEEMAAKASVKLTFPVVLFIFPAVLIVLAGPAIIGLFKSALFTE